ncbi:MAG: SdpI family protein [Haloarculaceae archaeon]
MDTKRSAALTGAIVVAMVAASALLYPRLPETMVTHWGASGDPNGTMSRLWGAFFVPALTAGVAALLYAVPKVDPRRENYAAFRPLYDEFVVVLTAFLALTHGLTLAVNLGFDVPLTATVFAGVGLLLIYVGRLLGAADRNWFVGIRTPWTLSDETVWQRTHEIGATLFKLSGLLAVVGAFVPTYGVYLVLGPVVASALFLVAYSYYLYERRDGDGSVAP